jgi:hypothetical protein
MRATGLAILLALGACTRANPDALDRVVPPPPVPEDLALGRSVDLAHDLQSPAADLRAADGASPGGPGVVCGTTVCLGAAGCCTADGGRTGTCVAQPADCAATSVLFACDGPEDCAAGEACCGGIGNSVSCTATAFCLGARLCHLPAACPAATSCCPYATGSPYRDCTSTTC